MYVFHPSSRASPHPSSTRLVQSRHPTACPARLKSRPRRVVANCVDIKFNFLVADMLLLATSPADAAESSVVRPYSGGGGLGVASRDDWRNFTESLSEFVGC